MPLPQLAGLTIERVESTGSNVRIRARVRADHARCPGCDQPSKRVHRRYRRHLLDTALSGRPVVVILGVRLFVCAQPDCAVRRFAELVEGPPVPWRVGLPGSGRGQVVGG
ncbi:MAG: transposase [Dactylosporangium sp.]|nr:hypothetical protein [Dactylosporangium sp.]NNJ61752.1 transposase [Dactylosporangium sp.]